jgi:hypothetical protein
MQALAPHSSLSQRGITNAIYGLLAESNQGTITIIDVFAEAVRLLTRLIHESGFGLLADVA